MTLDRKSEKPTIQGHFFFVGVLLKLAGSASGGPIFSLRERKDRGEKSAFGGYGRVPHCVLGGRLDWQVQRLNFSPLRIALRAALQLELGLVIVAF